MNKFRVKPWLAALCLVGGTLAAVPAWADIPFELDGNAHTNSPGMEDWADVNADNYNGQAGGSRTGLVTDRPEPNEAQFSGGGSKDEQDITQWKWRTGSPPDKDDISHAFSAQYIDDTNSHKILVFGMDRYDTNGDAQLGFWFLQDEVAPIPQGRFKGTHINGDILVLANFSNGGSVPTIQVFKWVNGAVVSQGVGQLVKCDAGGIPDNAVACGITNETNMPPAPVPAVGGWTYINKDVGPTSIFPAGGFFEGAVDITALNTVGTEPCFANFMAESRSSTSITAVLKDFSAHGFPACRVSVTKNCSTPTLSEDGDSIIYTITGMVTNDGGGTLHSVTLTDDPEIDSPFTIVKCNPNDPDVSGEFPLTTLDSGDSVCYQNTYSVSLDNNGQDDTITVKGYTAAGSTAFVDDEAVGTCNELQVNPELTITKECSSLITVEDNHAFVQVKATAEVCNTGDSPVNTVVVTDDQAGVMARKDLDDTDGIIANGTCEKYEKIYTPAAPDPANPVSGSTSTYLPGDVEFTDSASVTAEDIFGDPIPADNEPVISASDTCPLCVCPECGN